MPLLQITLIGEFLPSQGILDTSRCNPHRNHLNLNTEAFGEQRVACILLRGQCIGWTLHFGKPVPTRSRHVQEEIGRLDMMDGFEPSHELGTLGAKYYVEALDLPIVIPISILLDKSKSTVAMIQMDGGKPLEEVLCWLVARLPQVVIIKHLWVEGVPLRGQWKRPAFTHCDPIVDRGLADHGRLSIRRMVARMIEPIRV